jgi:hypothetical protein
MIAVAEHPVESTREPERIDRSWMGTVAGALTLCAGASSLVGGAVLAFLGVSSWVIPDAAGGAEPWPFAIGFVLFMGLSGLLGSLGGLAVVGGVQSLRHKHGIWPIIGAIAAAIVSLPLGIGAIVLTVLSEQNE